MSGRFITFEGGEGSGKTVQLLLLNDALTAANIPCVKTREPGGSKGADRIRSMLVSGATDAWDAETETLLFYAARLDHVNKVIKPALKEGKVVICDRFVDSTFVYQGVGKGLSEEYIHNLHRLTLGDFMPDLTIIFDIDPAEGLKRAMARQNQETRFEAMGLEFHQRIRQGFLDIAKREAKRCAVIDAARTIGEVQQQVLAVIKEHLGIALNG